MSFIKHSIFRMPNVNHKGITQVEFENAGDKIKVGMDKSVLASLESLSSEIKRNGLVVEIKWVGSITKNHSAGIIYHCELTLDGEILKINKLDSFEDYWN